MTKFLACGANVYIGKNCTFTHSSVSIGNNVYFGPGCVIQSAHGYIKIGNHVMFGPGVNVHGGNHIYDKLGFYMDENTKKFGDDPEIVIEDDVWIGANAIILSGVVIGKGAIVGAGSVVTKSVEPYNIVAGNPAHALKPRFTSEQVMEHESLLAYREKIN